jgi:hypothetical protein
LPADRLGNQSELSSDKPVPKVELPLGLGADLPTVGLVLIALAAYVVSGVLMLFNYRGSQKALERLRQKNPELFEAASVFPSMATLPPAPRLVFFLALGGLGIVAICLLYRTPDDFLKGLSAGLLLASPASFCLASASGMEDAPMSPLDMMRLTRGAIVSPFTA